MKKGEIGIGVIGKTEFPDKGFIIRDDGYVAIKHAIPGQKVEYVISKKRNGHGEGRVLNVIEMAECETNTDPCIHSGLCGGCLYQTLGYDEQLEIKEQQIKKMLDDVIEGPYIWEGIKRSPEDKAYRNKMEYSFGDEYKDGPLALGMHKRGSYYDIITTGHCKIVHDDFNKILVATLGFFTDKGLTYYHKMTHTGYLRHLLVRRGVNSKDLLIDLITTGSDFSEILVEWKQLILDLELEGHITGILHTRNDSLADAVINQGTDILYGQDYFYEELLGLRFKITPFSFFQTNSLGAEVLYKVAGEYIGDTKGQVVFDLYSGTGTIAQLAASVADHVVGVEIVEEAVDAAKENAELNGIENCRFIAGDVLKVIDELLDKPDTIILDPPRDGIHPKALPKIIEFGVDKIIYISCKPSSLVRDIQILSAGGYKLVKACAVDMFPNTPNCEAVAVFYKE